MSVEGGRARRYTHAAVDAPLRRVWPVVVAVQLGVLLAALDSTVVGTAMPTVIATLGGVSLYPWVFSAYMLASTAVMPVFGGVSDRLGRRGPFLAAVGVFCVGSLVAGAAPSMLVLIGGRAIQGIGAGGILALSLIIFGDLFPGARRGRMQGLISAVWGLASIAGPLLGGVIVDHWSWRWVFNMNPPLGAVVALLVLAGLRETATGVSGRRLDLRGTAFFLVGVTAVLFAFLQPEEGARHDLFAPGRVIAALIGLACLAAFVRIERGSPDPLLALELFRESPFVVACTAGFFAGAAMFGALVHVPLLIQWGRGTDATTAGLSLMTMSGGWSLGGLAAGLLVNVLGFWWLSVLGMAVMAGGYVGLAARPDAPWNLLMAACTGVGVGMGLSSITLIVAVQTLVRRGQRGIATSALLFFRNIGATLGVAAMGAVLTARLGLQVAGLGHGARTLPPPLAAAFVGEIGVVFWLGVGATLIGLGATFFLPRVTPVSATPVGERPVDVAATEVRG
ncbi:MAG: MFS transporter [Candidatus Rokubacteria bacterium]|nr:MFS transporter [Candidatus Rokubacteria bacterium]